MGTTLHLHLLGDFRLLNDDIPVTTVNTPRLQSLLAYLVLHRQTPQPRYHLAFLLWPDSTETQARTNLRNQFYLLRQALPKADRFLQADSKSLQWRPEAPFTLDVVEIETALVRAGQAQAQTERLAILETAAARYHGDLLPNCYDDWILPERERLQQQFGEILVRLIELLHDERNYPAAIHYAQRLLRHDPLHEAAYRRLMELYALNGDRAAALRTYHTCVTTLERELAVAPGPVTQELYERLLKIEIATGPDTPPATPLVAVSPLVGRRQEWAELQAAWQNLTSSTGPARLVLLTGEAGIGKTRLAEELLHWTRRQGIETAAAHCYASEGGLAYAPVITWLRARPLPPLEPVWSTEIARLLPEIELDHPKPPSPDPLTGTWQRQRLFEALARAALGGDSSQPRLFLLDDMQWCDRDTLEWLHYLLRFDPQARLLLVGTLRLEEVGDNPALETLLLDLRRNRLLTELALSPLNEAETASLAALMTGQELDPTLTAHLYRETEGSPLFVVEMIRAGLPLQPENLKSEEASRTSPPAASLPPAVQAIIQARLAQLSPAAHELTGLAATVGRAFTYSVLAEAAGGDEDRLVQELDELWQRRIIREQEADVYDFSHDKIREVAYTDLSPARRRWWHRRVAQALETLYRDEPARPLPFAGQTLDSVSGQVAAHYEQAGLPQQASPYYQRAAEVARRTYTNKAAATYYHKALALLPESKDNAPRRIELYWGLGQVLRVDGQSEAAAEAFTIMQAVAKTNDDPAAQARAWNELARTWFRRDNQAIFDYAEQARTTAQAAGSRQELVRALFNQGWANFRLKNTMAALALIEQALALGQEPDLLSEMAHCRQLMGRIRAELLGQFEPAVTEYKQALALFRALTDRVMEADTLSNLGEAYRHQGDYQTALGYYQEALALAVEIGYRDGQMVFRSNLGGAWVGLGEYELAERELHRVIELPEAADWLALSETYRFLAEAYLGQNKLAAALTAAQTALVAAQKNEQAEYIGGAWRILGQVYAELQRAGIKPDEHPHPRPSAAAQDPPTCFTESLRLFAELDLAAERARTLRAWADYELAQGDHHQGAAMWQAALAEFTRLGLTPEVERMAGKSKP